MASQGSINRVQDPESSLAPKDAALFKNMMEMYNFKNYKKALKIAETILVKYPNHGETLSVKALLTLFIDPTKEDEIVDLAKRGLRNGINSYLCWHILGVIYKQLKKYKETVKCFIMALKLDPHNDRLIKEICCLQIELKDYCGFRRFASSQLKLKSKEYREWVMFAFSQHLCGNLMVSCEILEEADRLFKPNYKVESQELSESIMYRAMLYEHTGQFIKCAKLLDEKASLLKDNITRLELKAKSLYLANNRLGANLACRELLKINPNNARYVLLYFMTHTNDKIRRLFLYPFNTYKRTDKGTIYEKKLENDSKSVLENALFLPESQKYAIVVSNEVLDIDGEYTSAGWSLENRMYHNFDLFVRAKALERDPQYMECYSYPEYALKVSKMLDLRHFPQPDSLDSIEEVVSVIDEYITECPGIDLVVYSKYRRHLKRDKYPMMMFTRSLTEEEEDMLVDALDELDLKDFFLYHCFVFSFTSGFKFYEKARKCIVGSVDRGSTNIFKMFIHCLTFKKAYILLFLLSKFSEKLLKRQRIDEVELGDKNKEIRLPEHEVSFNYRLLVVLLFLAKVYDFMGSFRKAIELLNLGYKISPTSIDVVCTRGKVYRHMGNYKSSNEDFCRGTDIDRSDRQTNAKAAKSILRTLDFEASVKRWKSFLTEDVCQKNDKEPPVDVPSFKFELMYAQLKYDIYLNSTLDEEEEEEESEYEEDSEEDTKDEESEKEGLKGYGYGHYREMSEKKENKKEDNIVIGTGDVVEHKRKEYQQEFEFKDDYSEEEDRVETQVVEVVKEEKELEVKDQDTENPETEEKEKDEVVEKAGTVENETVEEELEVVEEKEEVETTPVKLTLEEDGKEEEVKETKNDESLESSENKDEVVEEDQLNENLETQQTEDVVKEELNDDNVEKEVLGEEENREVEEKEHEEMKEVDQLNENLENSEELKEDKVETKEVKQHEEVVEDNVLEKVEQDDDETTEKKEDEEKEETGEQEVQDVNVEKVETVENEVVEVNVESETKVEVKDDSKNDEEVKERDELDNVEDQVEEVEKEENELEEVKEELDEVVGEEKENEKQEEEVESQEKEENKEEGQLNENLETQETEKEDSEDNKSVAESYVVEEICRKKKKKKPKVNVVKETKEERTERGQKCLKEAFEKYRMILEKHTEMYLNQLDFHNYCLNRLSMRIYYNFLKLRTVYCTQGYFIKALKGLIRCSLEMNSLGLETEVELEPEVVEEEKQNKIIIRSPRSKKPKEEKKNRNIKYCVQWMKTVLAQRVYDTGLYLLFYNLADIMKMDVLFKLQCIARCYYSSRCDRMNHHLIQMIFDFLVKMEKYNEFESEMVKKMINLCVDEDLLEEINYEELLENADKELAFKYLKHMINRVVSEKYEFKQVNALVASAKNNESSEFFEKLFLDSELLYNEITFKDYLKFRRCFIKAINTCSNEENKAILKEQMKLLKHLCGEYYVVDSF